MKYLSTIQITVFILVVMQLMMCGNASYKTEDKKPLHFRVSQNETDTTKPQLQNLIDSSYAVISKYAGYVYIKNKMLARRDSIPLIKKMISNEINAMENTELLKLIASAAGTKNITEGIKKDFREFYKTILQKENELVALIHEPQALKDSLEKIEKLITDIKPATEEWLNKIHMLTNVMSGPVELEFNNISYKIFASSPSSFEIKMHVKKSGGYSFEEYKTFLQKKANSKTLMITNAGMFKPDYQPQGLMISEGQLVSGIDTSVTTKSGNFYLYPNGIFIIDAEGKYNISETQEYGKNNTGKNKSPQYATQSGPMLVINNKIHNQFTKGSSNINIRSGVGKINDKKVIFINSNEPVNFYDFSLIFLYYFDCNNALYLDGAISKMYFAGDKSLPDGQFGPMISISKK